MDKNRQFVGFITNKLDTIDFQGKEFQMTVFFNKKQPTLTANK